MKFNIAMEEDILDALEDIGLVFVQVYLFHHVTKHSLALQSSAIIRKVKIWESILPTHQALLL